MKLQDSARDGSGHCTQVSLSDFPGIDRCARNGHDFVPRFLQRHLYSGSNGSTTQNDCPHMPPHKIYIDCKNNLSQLL